MCVTISTILRRPSVLPVRRPVKASRHMMTPWPRRGTLPISTGDDKDVWGKRADVYRAFTSGGTPRCGAPHFLLLRARAEVLNSAGPSEHPVRLFCTRAHRARKHTEQQPLSHYTQSPPAKHARACACVFNTTPDACLLSSSSPCLYLSHALCLINYTETGGLSSLIWKAMTPRRADPVTLLLTPKSSTHRPADTQIHTQKQWDWHLFTVINACSNCIKRVILVACGSFGAVQSWLLFRSVFFNFLIMFTGMLMDFQASADPQLLSLVR